MAESKDDKLVTVNIYVVYFVVTVGDNRVHKTRNINQSKPVTPRRRWGTPTDTRGLMSEECGPILTY